MVFMASLGLFWRFCFYSARFLDEEIRGADEGGEDRTLRFNLGFLSNAGWLFTRLIILRAKVTSNSLSRTDNLPNKKLN